MGESVRHRMAANPEGIATAFKCRMGKREVVSLRDKEYSPEQPSAFLLQKIKHDAEAFLGEPMEQVMVTVVPAYFDDNQHAATKDACGVLPHWGCAFVNERIAASLA